MQAHNNAARTAEPFNIIDNALRYCRLGWTVIPLWAGTKQPLVRWKRFQDRHSIEAELREWFGRSDVADVGIVTGRGSGLVVLDIDDWSTFHRKVREPLPPTPTVHTYRGSHAYFACRDALCTLRRGERLGFDLQAEGSLVVAPPSSHRTGYRYRWEAGLSPDDLPLAPVPEWLAKMAIPRVIRPDGDFWAQTDEIVTCPRPCIERLRGQKLPIGIRNECVVIWARDCRRRYCRECSRQQLRDRVLAEVTAAYKPSATEGERWRKELRQTVDCIMRTPAKPHSCRHPLLQKHCPGPRRCPYVQALRDRAEARADLSWLPEDLTGNDASIYAAIILLESRYSREPGEWIVCSQSDIAERAGCSRWRVNTGLPRLAKRGHISVATQQELARLIGAGQVDVGKPSGTAVRRLTHNRSTCTVTAVTVVEPPVVWGMY